MLNKLFIVLAIAVAMAAAPLTAGWPEGVAAFQRGDFTTAANHFQAVVDAQPDAAPPRFMLGQALQRLGHSEAALVQLRKAYELDPGQVAHQLALGQALVAGGALAEAVEVFAAGDASNLPPGQRAAYDRLVTATVGALLAEAQSSSGGDQTSAYAAAEELAVKLVSAVPTAANLKSLGQLQLGAEHFADAVRALERALGDEGDDWRVYSLLGSAHVGLDQFEEADRSLQEALTRVPEGEDQLQLWAQVGEVKEKLEQWEAAGDAYRRAGDPDSVARVEHKRGNAGEHP